MAELALAIIPIGVKVCCGLVSYLSGLKDRGDVLNRLTRQAESLEGSFRVLDTLMKRGQLEPTYYKAVPHVLTCLKNCEEGLKELTEFDQSHKVQSRLEHGIQRFCFPLRQNHLEQLESTLDRLCQPLSLAIQNLQLEIDIANSDILAQHTTKIQQATCLVSNLQTAVANLNAPINNVHSKLPLLQSSVDSFIPEVIPQINQVVESQLRAQMEEIRQSLQKTESAAIIRYDTTNERLSQLLTPHGGYNNTARILTARPTAPANSTSLTPGCCCQLRKTSFTEKLTIGSLYLQDAILTNLPHLKHCPFYVANLVHSKQRILRLTGIVRSLNTAFQLNICTTTGTGGFTISPSLSCIEVVDEKTAPAFRVFYSLWHCGGFNSSKMYQELCLEAVIQKLQDLFRSGRAKPTDINIDGLSLLHMLSRAMNVWYTENSNWQLGSSSCLESLFNFLIATGTSASAVAFGGQLALHIAAGKFAISASILGKLCISENDTPTSSPHADKDLSLEKIVEYYRGNLRVAEVLSGPLTGAIIRGDQEMVEQLIDRCPECLEETSYYGGTPLYFAVEKPDMLKLIVAKASPAQLVRSNFIHYGCMTPLGRAMKISGEICSSKQNDNGHNCPCVTAVKTLLDADCPIIPDRDFVLGLWDENVFHSASKHCKLLVSQSLRIRRRELREMAQKRLLKSEYSSLILPEGELDFYAVELDRLLQRKHFTSFGRLSTIVPDEVSTVEVKMPIYEPVYLFLSSPGDASIFLDLGFLDIDPSVESNHTYEDYFDTIKAFLTYISPQYAMWLHEYCPRFWGWVCYYGKLRGFHFTLADITGRYIHLCSVSNPDESTKRFPIATDVIHDDKTDSCNCLCCPSGCAPFDLIAKWLMFTSTVLGLKGMIRSFLKTHWKLLRLDHLICVVRQATFEDLKMTHTCFDKPRINPYGLTLRKDEKEWEEVEASKDDYDKLSYLNDFVAEFEDFMLGSSNDASTSKRSDNLRGVDCQRALVFWDDIRPKRIREIKKSLETTWDPDVTVLNDLGVSLWYEEEDEEDEDTTSETSEDGRARHFEKFMKNLKNI